jgi:hypothetical protein
VFLAASSGLAAAIAFASWKHILHWGAPVAMTLFCFTWLPMFYGSEISPNPWVAFSAIAAVGATSRLASSSSHLWHVALGMSSMAASMFRPFDACLVVGCCLVVALLFRLEGRRLMAIALTAGTGFAVGAAPWIVESYQRFGGIVQRLRSLNTGLPMGWRVNINEYIRLLDGPLTGPERTFAVDPWIGSWFALLAVVAVIGAWRSGRHRRLAQGSMVASALLAAPYVFLIPSLFPRFLLAALGLATIAAATGIIGLVSKSPVAIPLVVLIVGVGLVVNVSRAIDIDSTQTSKRHSLFEVAEQVALVTNGQDCLVSSQFSYPQMAIVSGCKGLQLDSDLERWSHWLTEGDEVRVIVVAGGPPEFSVPVLAQVVETTGGETWTIISRISSPS